MNRLDRSPARLSIALSLAAALLGATASAPYAQVSAVAGAFGVAILGVGFVTERPGGITLGCSVVAVSALYGGTTGAPVLATLFGVTAAIVSWDIGTQALVIGDQLGTEAPTTQLELFRAAATSIVGVSVITAGYLVYFVSAAGQSASAVLGLVLAVTVFVALLRRVTPVSD